MAAPFFWPTPWTIPGVGRLTDIRLQSPLRHIAFVCDPARHEGGAGGICLGSVSLKPYVALRVSDRDLNSDDMVEDHPWNGPRIDHGSTTNRCPEPCNSGYQSRQRRRCIAPLEI